MSRTNQLSPSLDKERALHHAGFQHIAGVDEAGRGAWAGPVVAAAVILPLPMTRATRGQLRAVNDSKQLTPAQREEMRERIHQVAVAWSVGCASNHEIDAFGILPATRLAMVRAVTSLWLAPDALLIDAVSLPELCIHQHAFNFADSISLSVAAASILAKTARDAMMCVLDSTVNGYNFASHKGYGTPAHARALAARGPCWAHRRTFKPIRTHEA